MVERWPHIITLIPPIDYVQDANGYISASTNLVEEITINGRVVMDGSGPGRSMLIVGENGDVVNASATISLPEIEGDYNKGQVVWNGKTYSIIKFNRYQARCKIWI